MFFITIKPCGNNTYNIYKFGKHIAIAQLKSKGYTLGYEIRAMDNSEISPLLLSYLLFRCRRIALNEYQK